MKKSITIILVILTTSIPALSQSDSTAMSNQLEQLELRLDQREVDYIAFSEELTKLVETDKSFRNSLYSLRKLNKGLTSKVDSLRLALSQNEREISKLSMRLNDERQRLENQVSETRENTKTSVKDLRKSINDSTLQWIVAILLVFLLVIVAFFLLRKALFRNASSMEDNLRLTRKQLEEEAIRLDDKLISIIEQQLKTAQATASESPQTKDHSLALKVADEIVRIEKNINQMDQSTRGLKQLSKAITRIRDNFAANGYEMIDMLNQIYEEGLKASVTFRQDSSLEGSQPIITRIMKPQVNHNGIMIQQAQIEVSQP